jgi:hypothetical protein
MMYLRTDRLSFLFDITPINIHIKQFLHDPRMSLDPVKTANQYSSTNLLALEQSNGTYQTGPPLQKGSTSPFPFLLLSTFSKNPSPL